MVLMGFIRITVMDVCIFDWVNPPRKPPFSKKAERDLKTENTTYQTLPKLQKRLSGKISPSHDKS